MSHKLICADWLDAGRTAFDAAQDVSDGYYACAFADPPDNTGLEYDGYDDNLEPDDYFELLSKWFERLIRITGISWISYNAKWTAEVGAIVRDLCRSAPDLKTRHMIHTYSFGQHNNHDLGGGYRPIWRLRWKDAPLYPDQIRIESKRQRMGDKRANSAGRVPSDVFDFPRVVGNSKQRRSWHKTQLNEGLVERCIKLSTKEGDRVLDPFAGTGTVLRVCRKIGRLSTSFEISPSYCEKIAEENGMGALEVDSPHAFLRCQACAGRIVKSTNENFVTCENGCGRITPLLGQIPTYASF